ncbi:MAG: alanine racemase [Alphaproteobacteria bacterium]
MGQADNRSAHAAPASVRLRIDVRALAGNWRRVAEIGGAEVETAAVIKGDGYGIGLERAAAAFSAAGCKVFFVATPQEGATARRCLPAATIYVLNGLAPGAATWMAERDLRPVLGSTPEVEEWLSARQAGLTTAAALHVDTGMNRLGLSAGELSLIADDPDLPRALGADLLMSHLACADTPDHPANREQLVLFRALRARFPGLRASLANSAGVFLGDDYHFDLTRPGIALYGAAFRAPEPRTLDVVVTAEAQVLVVREARTGEAIGYGARQTVKRASRIAIVGAGYADGYHRRAGSGDAAPGAAICVRGQVAPLIGRVSMDLIAIDVTDVPGVVRGDWVELFGANIAIDDVASRAETIGYELLTGLGRRAERINQPRSQDNG